MSDRVRVDIRLELSRGKNEMRGIKFRIDARAAGRQMERTVGEPSLARRISERHPRVREIIKKLVADFAPRSRGSRGGKKGGEDARRDARAGLIIVGRPATVVASLKKNGLKFQEIYLAADSARRPRIVTAHAKQ